MIYLDTKNNFKINHASGINILVQFIMVKGHTSMKIFSFLMLKFQTNLPSCSITSFCFEMLQIHERFVRLQFKNVVCTSLALYESQVRGSYIQDV